MEDSFSVRVKLETATKAVKKPVQRQTALCGLILSQVTGDLSEPVKEIKIPERLSELIVQLFAMEKVNCRYSKGKILIDEAGSSDLWQKLYILLSDIEGGNLTVEEARRFLRGAFWSAGYCSDPNKSYRIEFIVSMTDVLLGYLLL